MPNTSMRGVAQQNRFEALIQKEDVGTNSRLNNENKLDDVEESTKNEQDINVELNDDSNSQNS